MDIKQIVSTLDGYLHSLRRFSENRCDFSAQVVKLNGSIENTLNKHLDNFQVKIIGSSKIGYSELEEFFQDQIVSKLLIENKDISSLLTWDITEFIQMTFRDIEPSVDPLSTSQAYVFNVQSKFHNDHIYLVVPVEQQLVIVQVAERA